MSRSTQSQQAAEIAGSQELVQVTHVESPVLFYCRLVTDEEQFNALQAQIRAHVDAGDLRPVLPDVNLLQAPCQYALVYSIIRDRWCRARVLSYQRNADLKPINAKVCLIDYGSIEIVLWNENYVRPSAPEINVFNDGRGFCFPAALGNIKPFDESKPANGTTTGQQQWSSYANFLIEKETKSRQFMLCVLPPTASSSAPTQTRNIVNCDLFPLLDICSNGENQQFFSQANYTSLSAHLVESNVARYIDRDLETEFNNLSDDEKENRVLLAPH